MASAGKQIDKDKDDKQNCDLQQDMKYLEEGTGEEEKNFEKCLGDEVGFSETVKNKPKQWCPTRLDYQSGHAQTKSKRGGRQTCMRTDLESDLRLGYVHLNRPSSTCHCPLKTARARRTPVHTHIYSTW